MPLPAAVLKGMEEFNRRDFFEAHETLEDVWAEENGAARIFYQGLIQVAIGCCHVQRGNLEGARHLLAAGQLKLQAFAPAHLGIDVKGLLEGAARVEDEARRLGPEGLAAFDPGLFPVLRPATSGGGVPSSTPPSASAPPRPPAGP